MSVVVAGRENVNVACFEEIRWEEVVVRWPLVQQSPSISMVGTVSTQDVPEAEQAHLPASVVLQCCKRLRRIRLESSVKWHLTSELVLPT